MCQVQKKLRDTWPSVVPISIPRHLPASSPPQYHKRPWLFSALLTLPTTLNFSSPGPSFLSSSFPVTLPFSPFLFSLLLFVSLAHTLFVPSSCSSLTSSHGKFNLLAVSSLLLFSSCSGLFQMPPAVPAPSAIAWSSHVLTSYKGHLVQDPQSLLATSSLLFIPPS